MGAATIRYLETTSGTVAIDQTVATGTSGHFSVVVPALSYKLAVEGLQSGDADVTSKHLKAAAELLTFRRDKIQFIDAENNRFKEEEQKKQELEEEQEKPKTKGRKAKDPQKQPSSDEPENPSPK